LGEGLPGKTSEKITSFKATGVAALALKVISSGQTSIRKTVIKCFLIPFNVIYGCFSWQMLVLIKLL
jgi:hypothetical protein